MCGIVGYVGPRRADQIIIDALAQLEYRGYDSSGIATLDDAKVLHCQRSKGKLEELRKKLLECDVPGNIGIGHTRWATHGKPSDENAHPHLSERIAVVHNGIIENFYELKKMLAENGAMFKSETDTEIIPFLIENNYRKLGDFFQAVKKSLSELKGSFAFAALSCDEPDKIIVAKNASPLIIGKGDGEMFLASDIPALLDHTRDICILEDGELAIISKDDYTVSDFSGNPVAKSLKKIQWSKVAAEKEGYKHFMLKEIFEQPRAVADSMRSRLPQAFNAPLFNELSDIDFRKFDRMSIVACGTSFHAGMVAQYWIEQIAKKRVDVDLASEFRYRNPVLDEKTLLIFISQSGETADTLAALLEGKARGAKVLSISNCVDSSIARKSDWTVYTQAGPEIGVASTKAFTTQLAVLALLTLEMSRQLQAIDEKTFFQLAQELRELPQQIENVLNQTVASVETLSSLFLKSTSFLFLGRGASYPIAMEGALKLKEISYIHAESYAAGEMKHGPIALIDEDMPVLILATGGILFEKILSNIEEVRSRGAKTIVLCSAETASHFQNYPYRVELPSVSDFTRPILEVIPLQLLSYYISDKLGMDVDQPRNLAKSVTVE